MQGHNVSVVSRSISVIVLLALLWGRLHTSIFPVNVLLVKDVFQYCSKPKKVHVHFLLPRYGICRRSVWSRLFKSSNKVLTPSFLRFLVLSTWLHLASWTGSEPVREYPHRE